MSPTASLQATTLDRLEVRGTRAASLDTPTAVGSRTGLTQRETPASLQVIEEADMAHAGARSTREVLGMAAGAMVGNVPGNPAVVTMRGFAGNTVSILHDGVRLGASTIVTRDLDSWGLERVEVLRGPASVLSGEGALGGTINLVSRTPQTRTRTVDGMVGFGSFGTRRAGLDINQPLSGTVAVRGFIGTLRSDSLDDIERNATEMLSVGGSLSFRPDDRLSMLVSLQHAEDNGTGTYQGAPMLPADIAIAPSRVVRSANGYVVDRATRRTNYNPEGATTGARSDLLRWRTELALGTRWTLQNDLSGYRADRDFFYSDTWIYNAGTGLFDRTVERVSHDQRTWSERLSLAYDGRLGMRRNRFAAGVDYSDTDFFNPRRSGTAAPVSPVAPDVGVFPDGRNENFPGTGTNVIFDSHLRTSALFVEHALDLTPGWLLVGGMRWEHIALSRTIRDLNTGDRQRFDPDYTPFSWRLGSVFSLTPDLQVYGQFSSAVTPVSTLLTMRPAAGVFDLGDGRALEFGVKSSLWQDTLDLTAAVYRIERDDILTRDPANPAISVQGGSQWSQGAEVSAALRATRNLQFDTALTWGQAEYDQLLEAGGADRSGNRPSNVPHGTAAVSASYRFDAVPLSVGASGRHVGGFYTDTANTIHVRGHVVFDAWVGYDRARASAVLRVRNLGDALYGTYSGHPSTHIYLGAPRSVEMTLRTRF
ncbi:MAG: TonB-dependent receptor [Luteimonas sp.]